MNLQKINIRRMGAEVCVSGSTDVIGWVRNRGSRYFELDAPINENEVWHIVVGRENAPLLPWQPLERGSPSAPCIFLFNISHRTVVIDAPVGPWRSLWALRLLRDLLRWQLFHDGAVFIHASVVAHGKTGVALVGGKRSGKSTLLLQLLRDSDFGFVAEDDMTVVQKPDGSLVALGWPACLRIRRNMLKFFPQLADEAGFMHPANELERNGDPEVALLRMFPEEIATRFNSFITPEISLNMIVSAQWANQATVVPLSRDGRAEALISAWDILPERRAGSRPQFNGGTFQQWRDCCFNPPLFDFFGTPRDLTKAKLYDIAAQLNGYAFRHAGDPQPLRTLLTLESPGMATSPSGNT